MRATRGRDNDLERAVRRVLHSMGYRFSLHKRVLDSSRSRPDIVFQRDKIAVFVDGCFWHACPTHGTLPKANRDWWMQKLNANTERDRRHDVELKAAGWKVIRLWEHDSPRKGAARVRAALLSGRQAPCR
jgi:DNA mismatch endonuclease (patch repair protein)